MKGGVLPSLFWSDPQKCHGALKVVYTGHYIILKKLAPRANNGAYIGAASGLRAILMTPQHGLVPSVPGEGRRVSSSSVDIGMENVIGLSSKGFGIPLAASGWLLPQASLDKNSAGTESQGGGSEPSPRGE